MGHFITSYLAFDRLVTSAKFAEFLKSSTIETGLNILFPYFPGWWYTLSYVYILTNLIQLIYASKLYAYKKEVCL